MDEEKVLDETQKEVVAPEEATEEEVDEMSDAELEEEDEEEDEEEVEDEELDEDPAEEPKPEEEPLPKPAQSPEENAKYAAARRQSEAKERETRKQLDALLRATGYDSYEDYMNSNGLTKEEEDKLRADAERLGYDEKEFIENYLDEKYAKILRKKDEAARLKAEADKAQQERVQADLEAFQKNYPSTNVQTLLADAKFAKFAKGKTATQSLMEIYEDYVDLFGEIRQELSLIHI